MKTAVRKQDYLTGFVALAAHNRRGSKMCWTYMRDNWDKIESIYGKHDTHLIHFIEVNLNKNFIECLLILFGISFLECSRVIR